MNADFIINEEFAKLIPPLSGDELDRLEQSLLNEGCLNPIIVWNNTIIDGHHRYTICIKHNISFNVIEKSELETELDVKLWMINNQFSRRNLPTEIRVALAYKLKEFEAQKAKERQLSNLKQFSEQEAVIEEDAVLPLAYWCANGHNEEKDDLKSSKGKTLEIIAQKAGVSTRTAEQYDAIQRKGTEEQKSEVAEGKSSIKKVYTQIQKAERLEKNRATEWPKGKYRVIYADPPWQYGDERAGGNHGGAVDHYNTMGINELKNMPIVSLAEDNAVLFLWATAPLLPEALELINA